jgi:hypothetical protein
LSIMIKNCILYRVPAQGTHNFHQQHQKEKRQVKRRLSNHG